MPGGEARPSFSFDYELEADDLREWVVADRSIRKRRVKHAGKAAACTIVATCWPGFWLPATP